MCLENSTVDQLIVHELPALTPPGLPSKNCQSISESVAEDDGPRSSSPAPRGRAPLRIGTRTWGQVDFDDTQDIEDHELTGRHSNNGGNGHALQEGTRLGAIRSKHKQPQGELMGTVAPRSQAAAAATTTALPSRGAVRDADFTYLASPKSGTGSSCAPSQQDVDGAETVISGGLRNSRLLSPTRRSSAPATTRVGSGGRGRRAGGSSSSGSSSRKRVVLDRRRIDATPVWKRPVVPLSKPYVPLPRKNNGRF